MRQVKSTASKKKNRLSLFLMIPALLWDAPGWAFSIKHEAYVSYIQGLVYEKTSEFAKALGAYERTLKDDAEASYVHKSIADAALHLGDYERVQLEAGKIIKDYPDETDGYMYMGKACQGLGEYDKAEELFKQVLKLDSENREALVALIHQSANAHPEKALHYCKLFLDSYPDTTEVYIWMAEIKLRRGDTAGAVQSLGAAAEIVPDDAEIHCKLGQIYENSKDLKSAIAEYEKCTQLNNGDTGILFKLGELKLKTGSDEAAYDAFSGVLRITPEDIPANVQMAIMAEKSGRWPDAAKYLETVVSHIGAQPSLLVRLGYYYSRAGDTGKSLAVLRRLAGMDKSNPEYLYYYAVANEEDGKIKDAARILNEVLELDPDFAEAHFRLGVILDQEGKFKKALPHLKSAVELAPDNPAMNNYLGYSLADRNIELDTADKLIKQALKLDPDNGAFIDSYGWLAYRQGHYEEAVKYLEMAAKKLDDQVIFDHLGDACLKDNKLPQALGAWGRAWGLSSGKTRTGIRNKARQAAVGMSPELHGGIVLEKATANIKNTGAFDVFIYVSGGISKTASISFKENGDVQLSELGAFFAPVHTVTITGPDAKTEELDRIAAFCWNLVHGKFMLTPPGLPVRSGGMFKYKNNEDYFSIDTTLLLPVEYKKNGISAKFDDYEMIQNNWWPQKISIVDGNRKFFLKCMPLQK